jgi:hypothetical protein
VHFENKALTDSKRLLDAQNAQLAKLALFGSANLLQK